MPNQPAFDIREHLGNYLEGKETLSNFRDWFSPIPWSIEESGNQEAVELAYRIDGIVIESTSAGWTEQDLKEELTKVVRPFTLSPNSVQSEPDAIVRIAE